MALYLPLFGWGVRFGWVHRDDVRRLARFPEVFVIGDARIDLHGALTSKEAATEAVDGAMRQLAADGVLTGWRDERYAVAPSFGATAMLSVERAACPLLGIKSWGFHLNGYVRRPDGLHIWIAERAHDKPTYPGQLDNTVAGGHPEGLTLAQNVEKECAEEAGLSATMAAMAVPVGVISYTHASRWGLKPDEMFCYELALPEDVQPVPVDGEVHAFRLLPAAEVMSIVRDTDRFKYNCALCLIGFFIRHGLIDPDDEPDYVEICAGLNPGNRSGA